MRLMQLVYTSRPFGYDAASLNSILMKARHLNKRDDITGALICRDDIFLQMLEGPRDRVTAAFARILRDDRHVEVVSLLTRDLEQRLFPKWEMRHDPARSWLWTPAEVEAGAVSNATQAEILAVFTRIAAEPYTEEILIP